MSVSKAEQQSGVASAGTTYVIAVVAVDAGGAAPGVAHGADLHRAVAQGAGEILYIAHDATELEAARKRLKTLPAVVTPTRSRQARGSQLSPRQLEVLQLAARGCSSNEIARLLDTSFHTVNSHLKGIFKKLSVSSRSEAVFEATCLGILDMAPNA